MICSRRLPAALLVSGSSEREADSSSPSGCPLPTLVPVQASGCPQGQGDALGQGEVLFPIQQLPQGPELTVLHDHGGGVTDGKERIAGKMHPAQRSCSLWPVPPSLQETDAALLSFSVPVSHGLPPWMSPLPTESPYLFSAAYGMSELYTSPSYLSKWLPNWTLQPKRAGSAVSRQCSREVEWICWGGELRQEAEASGQGHETCKNWRTQSEPVTLLSPGRINAARSFPLAWDSVLQSQVTWTCAETSRRAKKGAALCPL